MFTFNQGAVLELSCCCKMPVLFMNESVHSEWWKTDNCALLGDCALIWACYIVTFRAGKWLLSSVDSFMFLQGAAMTE